MGTALKRDHPTPVNVINMLPRGTAGASTARVVPEMTVAVPWGTSGTTANAGLISWINPEAGTCILTRAIAYFSTTGTGTVDAGVSDDGTGAAADIFDGATMDNVTQALVSDVASEATLGALNAWVVGPGGTGTDNSVVAKTDSTATNLAGDLLLTYIVL